MDNIINKIMYNNFNKLSDVIRYAGLFQNKVESLSDHIVHVQLLGSLIINYLNSSFDEKVDYKEFLAKALHHDLDEVVTSDIPRPMKYYNKEVYDSIKRATTELSENFYDYYFKEYYNYWKNSKSSDKEGFLVSYCDMISVLIKSIEEVKTFSNLSFLRVIIESKSLSEFIISNIENTDFSNKSKIFLKKVITEFFNIINDIINKYDCNNYNILSIDFYKEKLYND